MEKKFPPVRCILSLLLAAALLLGACQPTPPPGPAEPATPTADLQAPADTQPATPTAAPQPEPTEGEAPPPAAVLPEDALVFAQFEEPAVNVEPSLELESIAPDLSNVSNPFILSAEQLERLGQNGFVVSPGVEKEFFTLYEKARYENQPVFITSDSLLHSYHLLFDKILRTAESQYFIPLLKDMNAALIQRADEQYQAIAADSALAGSPWEDAARRTVAYLGVAGRLLDLAFTVPAYALDLAEAELALIEAAGGIQPSPIFPGYDFGEDYTQYIPRGHYTMSEDLTAYFKSMMWYGRMTFRLKPENIEAGKAETRMALLLVQALRESQVNGAPAMQAWADLYSPTVFFVGRSDDLTILQYAEVIDQVYGPGADLAAVADESRLEAFIEAANQLPPPQILGMVISVADEEEAATKGLRFMGQRFVPDAYIFRQLIYRNVGTPDQRRGLPMGLDIPAAMGSERAYQILDELGETQYPKYPEQMEKVQTWLGGLSEADWTETLYNAWLYSFHPLLDEPPAGTPAFMQTDAWLDKQLNTVLGSWAELKHDTILYAKQVYAELGGGPSGPDPVPPKGYVEPVPHFYARLSALTEMTLQGLGDRGLLNDLDRASLERLLEVSAALQTMAEKELRGEPLTEEEYDQIRFFGGELERFVMAAADTDQADPFAPSFMEEEPQAAVIADVATDPDPDNDGAANPVVLEEAVGRINEIYVVVPIPQEDGSIRHQVAKGGVFSYYEFQWPANDRLTDEKWRAMLEAGEAPGLPEWTGSFYVPQPGYAKMEMVIHNFQLGLRDIYFTFPYYLDDENKLMPQHEEYASYLPELEELFAQERHVGKQLVSTSFLSFDLQSEDRAVVTAREVWDDTLYPGQLPDFEEQMIGRRGPYTVDVTYTLERVVNNGYETWEVIGVQSANQPPEWEMIQ